MRTVATIYDIPRDFAAAVAQEGGTWLIYMPGDPLPEPPSPSHEEVAKQLAAPYAVAVQAMLDTVAQSHAYDGILSMVSYAGDQHPKFGAEGAAAKAWRTACWATCYTILAEVESGARPMPTVAELLAELPVLALP